MYSNKVSLLLGKLHRSLNEWTCLLSSSDQVKDLSGAHERMPLEGGEVSCLRKVHSVPRKSLRLSEAATPTEYFRSDASPRHL